MIAVRVELGVPTDAVVYANMIKETHAKLLASVDHTLSDMRILIADTEAENINNIPKLPPSGS